MTSVMVHLRRVHAIVRALVQQLGTTQKTMRFAVESELANLQADKSGWTK
ncbi:hypothetical protein [Citricoccus sp. NR2]|nr:hypothetical protein [Citricoccus sp. NR2]WBL19769.1 hypothetical protein O1A05_03480 [Citricoccus sp. NR2]